MKCLKVGTQIKWFTVQVSYNGRYALEYDLVQGCSRLGARVCWDQRTAKQFESVKCVLHGYR